MSWAWLAWREDGDGDAPLWAPLHDLDGTPVGKLAVWPSDADEPEGAAKIDARAIDAEGAPAEVSLVLAPPGISVPFDDLAVGQAIRMVLSLPPVDVLSTLLLGNSRFVGALTATRSRREHRLTQDPFSRLFPARRLRVGGGLLGTMPAPTGPVGQRYGSDQPWPSDRFEWPTRCGQQLELSLLRRWARVGSNHRPRDYESPALTTELRAR